MEGVAICRTLVFALAVRMVSVMNVIMMFSAYLSIECMVGISGVNLVWLR